MNTEAQRMVQEFQEQVRELSRPRLLVLSKHSP